MNIATSDFHLYKLDWTAEKMVFSVNGAAHFIYEPVFKDPETWPFDNELYLLINVAIENTIDPGFETGQMEIDYVRVYAPDSKPDDLPVWFDEFN